MQTPSWVRIAKTWLIRWLPAILWMAFIFVLSAQRQFYTTPDPLLDLILKKMGHMALYSVLGILLRLALDGNRHAFALASVISVAYAISDEIHQAFVPGRGPSPVDVAIDVVGAQVGLAVFGLGRRIRVRGGDRRDV